MICIKSHKHQGADLTEIFVGISEVLAFLGWTVDRMWPLEALKREQAVGSHCPLLLLTAHCSPADTEEMLP